MRKGATITGLVVALVGAVAAPSSAVRSTAAAPQASTDWSGTYDGTFADAKATKIYENKAHFVVDGLKLSGTIRIRAQDRQQPYPDDPKIILDLCSLFSVDLKDDALTGIPVQGDEVNWHGEVTMQDAFEDVTKQPCKTLAPNGTDQIKLDITVGSAGMRGDLELAGSPITFRAKRSGSGPGGSGGSGSGGSGSGGSGSGGSGSGGSGSGGSGASGSGETLDTNTRLNVDDLRRANVAVRAGGVIDKETQARILKRLKGIDGFTVIGGADVDRMRGLVGNDSELNALAYLALALGHAHVPAGSGPKDAFPTITALAPVLVKLIAKAAGDDDGTARSTLRRLLDLAIQMDVDK